MADVTFSGEMPVELLKYAAADTDVIEAAQVSHTAINDQTRVIDPERFINALMRDKHGSPFEHNYMKFRINAPIFVFREFMRHRIGFSYNEISGRYAKLSPKFYVANGDRPLVNVGTPMKPRFEAGSDAMQDTMRASVERQCRAAYAEYEDMIKTGIALESARSVLPVGIFSEMVVSCNARSLMAFLSLRTSDAGTSHPQWEIEQVAKKMETVFSALMPITHASFVKNGRIAP